MPGEELLQRAIHFRLPRGAALMPIAMLAQKQQKAGQIDDVVALLPGVAQVAQAQPMAQRPVIQVVLGELKDRSVVRGESLDRTERIVGDVEIDVAPGFVKIRLLEDISLLHALDPEAAVGETARFKPFHE